MRVGTEKVFPFNWRRPMKSGVIGLTIGLAPFDKLAIYLSSTKFFRINDEEYQIRKPHPMDVTQMLRFVNLLESDSKIFCMIL